MSQDATIAQPSGIHSPPPQHARQEALPDDRPYAMLASDKADSAMTDEAREAAIVRAGLALEKHHAEWIRSGCFAARGDADRARRLMYLLIKGRSAGQVARMEQERGLLVRAVDVQEQMKA